LIGAWWAGTTYTHLNPEELVAGSFALSIVLSTGLMYGVGEFVIQPLRAMWQSILHLSPTEHGIAAPKLEKLQLGRELVTSLMAQVYQMTDIAERTAATDHTTRQDLSQNFIANNLPLPFIVLDATETIQFANQAAADYTGMLAGDRYVLPE